MNTRYVDIHPDRLYQRWISNPLGGNLYREPVYLY